MSVSMDRAAAVDPEAAPATAGAVLTPALMRRLDEEGYVVVPGVFTAEECAAFRAGMRDDILAWTQGKVDLYDTATWRRWIKEYYPMHAMLVQHGCLGRSKTPEAIRFHPKVAEVFATLHGVSPDELFASFDALSVHLPPERTPGGEKCGFFRSTWLHTDQGPASSKIKHPHGNVPDFCVQGQVVINGARECDATLLVLPGSHRFAPAFFEAFPPKDPEEDWQQLKDPRHEEWFAKQGCVRTRVAAPEGSMVLWNSSTVHCGVEPERGRPAPYPIREVVYVCMLPRPVIGTKGLAKLLKRRQDIYNGGRVSSHHPLRPRTFPVAPRTYGGKPCQVQRPTGFQLSDLPPAARVLVDGGPAYVKAASGWKGAKAPPKKARKRVAEKEASVFEGLADADKEPDTEVPGAFRKRWRMGGEEEEV